MDIEDIGKLKVAELRAILQSKGLDSKGNKPILVERVRQALEAEFTEENESEEEIDNEDSNNQQLDNEDSNNQQLDNEDSNDQQLDDEDSNEQQLDNEDSNDQQLDNEDSNEQQLDNEDSNEQQDVEVNENGSKERLDADVDGEDELELENNERLDESLEENQEMDDDVNENVQAEQNAAHDNAEDRNEAVDEDYVEIPDVKEEMDADYFDKKSDYEEAPTVSLNVKEEGDDAVEVPTEDIKTENIVKEETEEAKSDVKKETEENHQNVEQRGVKRSQSPFEERSKRVRNESASFIEDEPDLDNSVVTLDWYNSDLSLIIDSKKLLSAKPMTQGGFAYVWHGARSNLGCVKGKVFYEVKITDEMEVRDLEKDEQHPHVLRCGWSLDSCSLILGEEKFSYGFGGTGKASTDLKFKDYGATYGKGDIVGCFLDMDSSPMVMSFTINGKNHGICYEISHEEIGENAFFPHVLTKNCGFEVNFGQEEPWQEPLTDYTFIGKFPVEDLVLGTQRPEKHEDIEVIMMVGLPAAGKSTWVEKYMKEVPEKKYNVLSTNNLIDRMKVMGLPRKRNYSGRWENLIKMCTDCLNKLLNMSYKRRRNFIIDQTNVYPSAQKRKIKGFVGCTRRAVVICPTDDDLKLRTKKREAEEGKDVPDKAVLEMKANFKLPETGEFFDSVEFIELQKEDAEKLIEQYNKEGERAGFGPRRMSGHSRFSSSERGGSGGGGYRRGNFNNMDRRGGGGFNNRGGGYRGGWDRDRDRRGQFDRRDRGGGGGWNRDGGRDYHRDHHNRSGGGGSYHRDNRSGSGSGGGYNRDRQSRFQGSGWSGGSGGGGYKGGQNQNNAKSGGGWGNYNQSSQGYGGQGQGWGSQGGGYGQNQSWGQQAQQQGYNAAGGSYNWNQQYYGSGQVQPQQTTQQAQQAYWQGYNQPAYSGQQNAYGTSAAAANYGYGQQSYGQGTQSTQGTPQSQSQSQWQTAGYGGTTNNSTSASTTSYDQSSQYRK